MTSTHQQLEGRVFTRLKQYEALPSALQDEIHALEQYLTKHQAEVFEKHHPHLVKSAVGVKYKELLEKIDAYLASHETHRNDAQSTNRPLSSGMPHGQHAGSHPTARDQAHHAGHHDRHATLGDQGAYGTKHGYAKDPDYTGTGAGRVRDEPTLKNKAVHAKEKAKDKITGQNYDQHEYAPHDVSGTRPTYGTTPAGHRTGPDYTHSTAATGYRADPDYTGTGAGSISAEPTMKDKAIHAKEKAKDKMTPDHDRHATTHGYSSTGMQGVTGARGYSNTGGVQGTTTTGSYGHGTDPNYTGTGAGGVRDEPTMTDKAVHGKEKTKDKMTGHYDQHTPHGSNAMAHHSTTQGDGHIHGTRGIAGAPAGGPLPTSATTNQHVGTTEEVKAKITGHSGELHHTASAQKLVEGLVLKGFITPYKEDNSLPNMNIRESFDFKDIDLFVPVAPSLAEPSVSVWDVTLSGAIYAGMVKRKANIIEKIKHGKDVYVVANERSKTLTIFDTDLSREAVAQVKASGTRVAMDTTYFDHGIRVWNEAVSELFDQETKPKREVFVDALQAIGMRCDAGLVSHGKHVGAMHEVTDGKGMPNVHDKMKHDHKESHGHKGMPNVHDNMMNQPRNASPTRHHQQQGLNESIGSHGHTQQTPSGYTDKPGAHTGYDKNMAHGNVQQMGSSFTDKPHQSNAGYMGVTGNPSQPTPSNGGGQTMGYQDKPHSHDPTSSHTFEQSNKPTTNYTSGNCHENIPAP